MSGMTGAREGRTVPGRFWKELRKHVLLYFLLLRNCLASQLEYRVNFLTGIAMEAGYLLVKLLYVIVIYRTGVTIRGLRPDEMLLFAGTFILISGLYAGLFMMNNFQLGRLIRDGSLDLLITKPVSLQFLATLSRTDLGLLLTDFIAGAVMIVIGWSRLGLPVTPVNVAGFAWFTLGGAMVGYSLFLLPQLLSFRFVNVSAIAEVGDSFWDFNNMPMQMYNRAIQQIGVFVLPIFVITNFPALFILRRMSTAYFIWGIAAPIIMLALVRLFWRTAIRNYSSASS